MPAKQRIHNEWFMPIKKTICPCGQRKTQVFAWGEYGPSWRTVQHFCQVCFKAEVLSRLVDHAGPCGCSFRLNPRMGYGPLPEWIKTAEVQGQGVSM